MVRGGALARVSRSLSLSSLSELVAEIRRSDLPTIARRSSGVRKKKEKKKKHIRQTPSHYPVIGRCSTLCAVLKEARKVALFAAAAAAESTDASFPPSLRQIYHRVSRWFWYVSRPYAQPNGCGKAMLWTVRKLHMRLRKRIRDASRVPALRVRRNQAFGKMPGIKH